MVLKESRIQEKWLLCHHISTGGKNNPSSLTWQVNHGMSEKKKEKNEKNPNIENKKHTKQNKNHLEIPE